MFRSTFSFNRKSLSVALAFMLAAGAFLSTHPHVATANRPVYPTKVAHSETSSPRTIDLGAGYTLVLDGAEGKIVAPAVIVKYTSRTMDLGAGYTLVLDGAEGKIVAPAVFVRADVKSFDLGAGYRLEVDDVSGRIIAPALAINTQPATNNSMDTAAGGKPALDEPQEPVVHRMYLGGGYWLVTDPQGGQIVKEGSR